MTLYIGNRPVSVNSGIIFQDTRKCGVNISNLIGDVEFGKLNQPIEDIHFKIPDGVTDLGDYALSGLFTYNNKLKSVDFSNLERISGDYACQFMFYDCNNLTSLELNNIEISGDYACYNMFYNCTKLTTLDIRNIKTISGEYACYYMFRGCNNLTDIQVFNIDCVTGKYALHSFLRNAGPADYNTIKYTLDLSHWTRIVGDYVGYHALGRVYAYKINLCNLKEIIGNYAAYNLFYYSNSSEIDLSNLETISGDYACSNMIYYYVRMSHLDLHSLRTISGNYACSNMVYASSIKNLESVDLSSLQTISGDYACSGMFYGCNKLATISFPSLTTIEGTDPFGTSGSNLMFYNCTGLKEIHFKADMQATIEAIPGYSTKWGATNATIYFDL